MACASLDCFSPGGGVGPLGLTLWARFEFPRGAALFAAPHLGVIIYLWLPEARRYLEAKESATPSAA